MKKSILKAFFIAAALLSLNSCKNLFEDSIQEQPEKEVEATAEKPENGNQQETTTPAGTGNTPVILAPVITTINFTGTITVNGAVPSTINNAIEAIQTGSDNSDNSDNSQASENQDNQNTTRTATASLPDGTEYEYYVKAYTQGEENNLTHEKAAEVDEYGQIVYQLPLEIDHTWYLTAGFRKKASGTQGQADYVEAKILMQDLESVTPELEIFSFELTETYPGSEHNFILRPLQTENGHGALNLTINELPTGTDAVSALKLFVSNENGQPVEWMTDELDISITGTSKYIRSNLDDEGNISYNIPSGAYEVMLNFYRTDSATPPREYLVYQTIQTINIFDDMVTNTWVRETASSAISGDEVITSGGNFELSTTHINRFLNTTFYVGQPAGVNVEPDDNNAGTAFSPLLTLQRAINIISASGQGGSYRIYITGTQTGPFTIPATINSSKASSIEISGLGNTRAVLTQEGGGSVLNISAATPITFKNIQITGGNTDQGSGIYMDASSVILGAGALVGTEGTGTVTASNCGNWAETEGAGIYMAGGDLVLKKGSKVSRNFKDTDGGLGGGGIFCENGAITIERGAEVSDNRAYNNAGGIYLNGGSITMQGGSISGNTAGSNGGGVYIASGSMIMSGAAAISGNTAGVGNGGAVYVTNGTTFKVSGSVSIPYGVNGVTGIGKNDVYIDSSAYVTAGVLSGTGTVATITPSAWTRGLTVLKPDTSAISGITENIKNRFALTNDSFEFFIKTDAVNGDYGIINAPYYVSGGSAGGAQVCVDSEGNAYTPGHEAGRTGAKDQPFDTLGDVFQVLNDANTDFIIKIDGRVRNIQGDTVNVIAAKSITIEGASADNTHDILDNSLDTGSVLKVDGGKTVIIKNLKLTGGNGGTTLGGGITIANGIAILGPGAWITGNQSDGQGGGVYVQENGSLFMYGSAAIGDKDGSAGLPNPSSNQYGNKATKGGGISNESGKVFLGYKGYAADGTTPVEETLTGGLYRNYAYVILGDTDSGQGGAIMNTGTLVINSGNICNNLADTTGGGIFNDTGSNCTLTGGTLTGNSVDSSGSINSGAIFNKNSLTINGTVNIPGGAGTAASPLNDICVANGKYLTLGSNFNVTNGTTIKLTPETVSGSSFKKRSILTGDALTGNNTTDASIYAKFDLNAPGFKLVSTTASSVNYGMLTLKHIVKTLYVASVGTDSTRTGPAGKSMEGNPTVLDTTWQSAPLNGSTYCFNDNGTTDVNSNSTYPFTGIEKALQFITYQETTVDENGTAFDYTIMIDGRVNVNTIIGDYTNANYRQRLAATASDEGPATVTKIILKSKNTGTSDTAPKDLLDANGTNQPCLIIQTAVPVQIEDLGITGGNNTENMGGGIKIASGSKVTLCGKTQVYGNSASAGGGGIENCGTLLIYGKVVIGKAGAASTPSETDTGINSAEEGGGIYNNGGKLYLGYSDTDSDHAAAWDGAIISNYASVSGGGIYSTGENSAIYFARGSISYNEANGPGGGIYTESPVFIWGDAVVGTKSNVTDFATSDSSGHSNASKGSDSNGGGVYCTGANAKLYLGYKELNAAPPVPVQDPDFTGGIFYNYSQKKGGGIYCVSSASVEMCGGTISLNKSVNNGGGICLNEANNSMTMNGGTISRNQATQYGGGVYTAGNFTMYGESVIGDSSKTVAPTGSTDCSNYALKGGGIYFASSSASTVSNLNSGVIAGNYASDSGGAIAVEENSATSGTVNIKNSINYNSARLNGGGIYTYPGLTYNLEDTKMTGNKVTDTSSGRGGAIEVYNENVTLTMKGDISIPCTAVRENDIFLGKGLAVAKIKVAGGIGGKGAFASITLNLADYSASSRVLTTASGVDPAILPAAACRLKVTPKSGTPWYVGGTGYLTQMPAASALTEPPVAGEKVAAYTINDIKKLQYWVNGTAYNDTNANELENVYIELQEDLTLDSTWGQSHVGGDGVGYVSNNEGIGIDSHVFKGHFDGNNHTLTYNNAKGCLFSKVTNSLIENLNIEGTIESTNTHSALVDEMTSSTVRNIINRCNVTSTNNATSQSSGGIVGGASGTGSSIIDCINYGNMTGGQRVGGIVGEADACSILNCEQHGNVTGTWQVGGIAAGGGTTGSVIENCCVTGNLTSTAATSGGRASVGGIICSSNVATHKMYNCCFTGAIDTSAATGNVNKGGILSGSGIISNFNHCYYVGPASLGPYQGQTSRPGATRVSAITTEEISALNNPVFVTSGYNVADPSYADITKYRKWTLDADNKPKLIR